MIRGIHGLLYSSDPDATRAFFREVMALPGSDVGEGWWIFDFAEGDLGVHPTEDAGEAGTHDVSFYCDDIHGTVKALAARGVEFTQDVEDHGYGLVTHLTAPGGIRIQLYEPRYVKGVSRAAARRAPRGEQAAAKRAPAREGAPAKRTKPARRGTATRATRATGKKKRR
jgi:predicted enzyme related to lactoylglutathione lyase